MGCGGKEGDSSGSVSASGEPYVNIVSPSPGAFLDEGVEVSLEAEGRRVDGSPAELEDASWTTDAGFSATGNPVVTAELPAGVQNLTVTGSVEGTAVSATIEVSVFAAR